MRAADGSDWAEIRVFDFCRDQAYLPFEETVVLAKKYGLPLVARVEATLDLPVILGALRKQNAAIDVDQRDGRYQNGFHIVDSTRLRTGNRR